MELSGFHVRSDKDSDWQLIDHQGYCYFGVPPDWSRVPPDLHSSKDGIVLTGYLKAASYLNDPVIGMDAKHSFRRKFFQPLWRPHYIGIYASHGKTILTYLRFDNGFARGVRLGIYCNVLSRHGSKSAFIVQKGDCQFIIKPVNSPVDRDIPLLRSSSDPLLCCVDEADGLAYRSKSKITLQ